MKKLMPSWTTVVLFFLYYCLGAAEVEGFWIPKVQPHQTPRLPDSGAFMSSNAMKTQELRRAKGHERLTERLLLTTALLHLLIMQ